MYSTLLKLATDFERLVLAQAPKTIPGSRGAYQELLAGYKGWSKYTGGKNLSGQLIDSGVLDYENPTIVSVFEHMEGRNGPGDVNVGLIVQPNLNVVFKVSGKHPAVRDGSLTKMLHSRVAPIMHQAIKQAVNAQAIMPPSEGAPVSWNWLQGLRTA